MITYQAQPTNNTCVSTCLAMVLGVPVQQVIDQFHEDYMQGHGSVVEYLEQEGCKVENLKADNTDPFEHGYVYLATVPSLNTRGTLHTVLLDCTGERLVLLDPNNDPELMHYVLQMEDEDDRQYGPTEFPMISWVLDYKISAHAIRKARERHV